MKNFLYRPLLFCLFFFSALSFMPVRGNTQGWAYSKGVGSNIGTDRISSTAVDSSGNVYITGSYTGTVDFGTGALPAAGTTAAQLDGFVAKFDASGVCQWTIRFNGPTNASVDQGLGIATDGSYVYFGGTFQTSLSISGSTAITGYNGYDGFAAKLDATNGTLIWANIYGSNGQDAVQSLCIDKSGNVYIAGQFSNTSTFGSITRTVNSSTGNGTDMVTARLNNATGAYDWVSTGGSYNSTDNASNCGIAYVPDLDVVVMAGSFGGVAGTTQATYATISPASSVILTSTGNQDIAVLKMNATTGAFLYGIGVGGASGGSEEALAATYDSFTQQVVFTGYFTSTNLVFGSNAAVTVAGQDDAFFTAFNPSNNTFTWAKSAGSTAQDRTFNLAADGLGSVFFVGRYRGTLNVAGTSLTATSDKGTASDEMYLLRANSQTGVSNLLLSGNGVSVNAIGNLPTAICVSNKGNVWLGGTYSSTLTLSPLSALVNPGTTADILLARYDQFAPLTATPSQVNATCDQGTNGTATVSVSGGYGTYIYAWSPTGGTAANATGLSPGAYTVTITDAIKNVTTHNFNITVPGTTVATGTISNTAFPLTSSNTMIADASCNLIARVVPNGENLVAGNVSGKVWVETSVPAYPTGVPYVQRHYEITPATNASAATGRVTLYFTQTEFDNFNAAPGSTPDLPAGPSDAAGIGNLYVAKFSGVSSDNSGTPASYSGNHTLINPADGDIIWNAGSSRWEVSFDVTGFSGFLVQTSQSTLPVKLLSFAAQKQNNDIQLLWRTADEIGQDQFEIERSQDGTSFTSIGQHASAGASTSYAFTDAGITSTSVGPLYYRLKVISKTGQATYSAVIKVSTALAKGSQLSAIALPNPFKNELSMNMSMPAATEVRVSISDMTGRIKINRLVQVPRGFSAVAITEASNLSKGVYMLVVEGGGQRITQKIIKE